LGTRNVIASNGEYIHDGGNNYRLIRRRNNGDNIQITIFY